MKLTAIIALFIATIASTGVSAPTKANISPVAKTAQNGLKRDVEKVVIFEGREYNPEDQTLAEKFWKMPLEEQRKFPRQLRLQFVKLRQAQRIRAEQSKVKGKNIPPKLRKPYEYNEEEKAILERNGRVPSRGERLDIVKYGKVSKSTKIGNKHINLEIKR